MSIKHIADELVKYNRRDNELLSVIAFVSSVLPHVSGQQSP